MKIYYLAEKETRQLSEGMFEYTGTKFVTVYMAENSELKKVTDFECDVADVTEDKIIEQLGYPAKLESL